MLKKYWIDLCLLLVFVASAIWLVWDQFKIRQTVKTNVLTIPVEVTQTYSTDEILVDVSGEVVHPDVYKLGSEARIKDAIEVAGGVTENADGDYIKQSINLAARLIDGQKIFIPAKGAKITQTESGNTLMSSANVSVNSASSEQLQLLWGVGEARAASLISGRPYRSLEEIVTKKIWPASVLEKNKDKLTL